METNIKAVNVVDRGWHSPAYTGVRIRTIVLPWVCPKCGEPRGEPYRHFFMEDGVRYDCHRWDNECCGHIDRYSDVIDEWREWQKDPEVDAWLDELSAKHRKKD